MTAPIPVQRSVRAFIAQGAGLQKTLAIPGNDPGPRPREPYCAVLFASDEVAENATLSRYRDLGSDPPESVIDHDTIHEARVEVTFYRRDTADRIGAHAMARNFLSWAGTEEALQAADRAGFRLQGRVSATNADSLVDGAYEERALVVFTVAYRFREPVAQSLGVAENVEITIRGPAQSQTTVVPEN